MLLGRSLKGQGTLSGTTDGRVVVAAARGPSPPGQAIFSHQPAEAAAQGEASDAGIGDGAPGGGQPECLRLTIEFSPGDPARGASRALPRIDAHTPHTRQVDHQTALAHGVAWNVVAAAAHRHQELMGVGELDRADDIGHPGTASDERRALVDHAVPDLAGISVAGVAGTEQLPAQADLQGFDGSLLDDAIRPVVVVTCRSTMVPLLPWFIRANIHLLAPVMV
jgi:hypothetical protein